MWTLKSLSTIRNTPGLSQKTAVFCRGITIYFQVTQSRSFLARRRNLCLSGARLTKAVIGGSSIVWPRPRITSCSGRDCGVISSTRGSGKITFVSAGGPSTSGGAAHSVDGKGSERYIVAARKLVAGEVVFDRVGGRVLEYSTRHSFQVGERQHLDVDSDVALTNHSCVPNCLIEIHNGSSDHVPCVSLIVRAAEIQEGELITLDYNVMEIDMSDPFDCLCGAPKCRGRISGFSNLAPDIQAEYIAGDQTSRVGGTSAGAAPDFPPLTPMVKAWLDASRNKL